MTMLPPDVHAGAAAAGSPPVTGLERVLRAMSVFTMLMTLPQVITIWGRREAHGVSLVSWATYLVAASLWFVYGVRKRDKTIYLACIGWILLDVAIVVGVLLYG
ncbi:MAG TPA: SemiSWEET family transporter [Anaeromyxobacter sp.]